MPDPAPPNPPATPSPATAAHPGHGRGGRLPRLQRGLDRLYALGGWLALPVAVLLLAQWPLRSLPGGRPQLANDLAQALFALYVALALAQAWRRGAHLSTGLPAQRRPGGWRAGIRRALALAVVLPGSLALLWLALPQVWRTVQRLESFPESFNPGYWVISLAMAVLLGLLATQALLQGLNGDQALLQGLNGDQALLQGLNGDAADTGGAPGAEAPP